MKSFELKPLARTALLACVVVLAGCRKQEAGVALEVRPAPDIQASAVDGQPFHLRDYRGRVVLLTFGYTSCPDVCPLTLSRVRGLLRQLGPRAGEVTPVFVSVDPERDTPERLRTYLDAFDPHLRGLSLPQPALQPLLEAYGVTATRRLPDARRYKNLPQGTEAPYSIDHTAGFFVVDKGGQLRLRFPHETPVEQLAPAVLALLEEASP